MKTLTAQQFIEKKKAQFKKEKYKKIRVKDISRKGWHILEKKAITGIRKKTAPSKSIWLIEEKSLKKYVSIKRKPGPKSK